MGETTLGGLSIRKIACCHLLTVGELARISFNSRPASGHQQATMKSMTRVGIGESLIPPPNGASSTFHGHSKKQQKDA